MNARSNAIDVIHQFGMIVPSLDVQVPPLMIFGLFIFFYYQINVGTSCPGCNGWEYICFVDTPPNHPCGTRKMLYVFIDQNLKWMSCV